MVYIAFVAIVSLIYFRIEVTAENDRIINGTYLGIIMSFGIYIRYRINLLEKGQSTDFNDRDIFID